MFLALEHLVSLGHRRILIMRGAEYSSDADDRHASLLAAAERVGLTLDPELMLTLATDQLTPEGAFRAFAGVLTRKPAFTAIFAFNDLSALGAIRAMADCGLSCPEDISVLGVDDISTASFALPRLTTAAQPLEDMGAAAVEQLIRKIQKPDEPQVPRVLFPMTLMVRESTGPVSSPESRILAEKRRLHAAESQFAVTTHR
jgi:LacI family transcriptional regulator